MKLDNSVSLVGKAGDVSSIEEVRSRVEHSIDKPPAEALINNQKPDGISAWKELKALNKRLFKSPKAKRIYFLLGMAITILILDVIGEIRMNKWQGDFFRAIEQKNLPVVGQEALMFIGIMLVLLTFVVTQNWFLERVKIRYREWLTSDLMDEWMKPGHAYRLNMTSEENLNPDQRIQEDVKNFCELSAELGIGALRASLMLICFVGVLWKMSSGITLPIPNLPIVIPGYMVWFALIYAVLGTWMAAKAGAPLIKLNEERYTREANFRYSLVRISDNAESISFYSGEKDERKIADKNFKNVLKMMSSLSYANARLTWISCGHGWMVVILPVLIALPGYMQGKLDFGSLMMVVGAFNQVQTSLRWIVENFGRIADWRAALHRVVVFKNAILTVDEYENAPEMVKLLPHKEKYLEFDKTGISLMDGKVVIADATATVYPGERVLISGESGSGKSTLLRAVGGLWPWGSGTIKIPPKEEIMFLPQKPYIPLGTLAFALTYPNTSANWDRSEIESCLERVNLEAFIPMLDKVERWDKLMSLGQQQRLAFARLLLHKPKWIFLDEATSALDDDNQELVMTLLVEELADSAVLSIAHRQGLEQFHTRTLHLKDMQAGRVLVKKTKDFEAPKRFRRKLIRHIGSALKFKRNDQNPVDAGAQP